MLSNCINVLSISECYFPFHAVNCSGPPLPPINGSIGFYVNAVEGAMVAFFCNEGLIPAGQMNATCTSNGSWTPNPADLVCIEPPPEDEGVSTNTYLCMCSCLFRNIC